jgi:N-acetylmuramic acid 6-phosphate (MurNAc-6-P) etherase
VCGGGGDGQQQATTRYLVLNPVVGPEAVTGSSRMKGGSTTLVVLHAAFASAFTTVFQNSKKKNSEKDRENDCTNSKEEKREIIQETREAKCE